jgi:glycosyl transferase family 25
MKIFTVHYKKLTERKKHIENQLSNIKNLEINHEFVEQFDRDNLNENDTKIFNGYKDMANIAICLSHFYCYQQICEKYDYALIFEDDVILSKDFSEKIKIYIEEIPEDWDMLFIGDGCNLHYHNTIAGKNIYLKDNELKYINDDSKGATRCADSYLVNKKCAIKLCNYIKNLNKINRPVDFWLNTAIKENNFIVYWAEPTIVTQGTQNGMFKSSHIY